MNRKLSALELDRVRGGVEVTRISLNDTYHHNGDSLDSRPPEGEPDYMAAKGE